MDLLSLLDAAVPADETERAHLERMRAVAALGAPALRRDHYAPGHFTASAFVLSPDGRRIALLFHPKLKRWLQPGGHLEPGDPDVLSATKREIEEEIGIRELQLLVDGLFDLDVHQIPASPREPAHLHLDLRYAFRSETERLDGEHEARWVPLEAVNEVESDASVTRAVAKLRGLVPARRLW